MIKIRFVAVVLLAATASALSRAEDGYELWLRYRKVDDPVRLEQYRGAFSCVSVLGNTATAEAVRKEFQRALPAMLDESVPVYARPEWKRDVLLAGTFQKLEGIRVSAPSANRLLLGDEGFLIRTLRDSARVEGKAGRRCILIAGNTDRAVLYGSFHFLRLIATHQSINSLDVTSIPRIRFRMLDHWDNLDGSVERGYAGRSLWKWDELPGTLDPRYGDYARACASVGINGAVLNNVNARAESLTREYLEKAAAIAYVFRSYGIRVYLSARFSAPMQLGGLKTADPRDPAVAGWWKKKADEIYRLIPDFGGFLVKANSESQPGPQEYGATHADGANMLADALAPHGGIVIWRAFVYDTRIDADRAKCAYKEFVPLDGRFKSGAFVQVKNGPIDFQPREPFHPMFGAMPRTPLMLELQVTQEYLGQSVYLVFLAPMWKEILESDTYAKGPGSTVAEIVDGSADGRAESGIAGVANTGSDRNWCGHPFAQANWYAFGRLAWNHQLTAEAVANEWIGMTWSNDPAVVDSIRSMMLGSWEACLNAMTPLGLHHIMKEGVHYGPEPSLDRAPRADWNSIYYHRADSAGLGFERGSRGSDAVSQYHGPLRERFDGLETCPEKVLLWFHHVPWDHQMQSGRTLWEELHVRYDAGVEYVARMRGTWKALEGKVDPERWKAVEGKLKMQEDNAREWRKVCLDYFGKFVKK
jgi:alpha-glucuronidase